jgi:membrane protein required for colicin V production
MSFAVIDFVFALLMVLFALRGYIRGFVSEVMALASVVFGLLAAIMLFRAGGGFIRERFMQDIAAIPEIIAFAAIFLIVFIITRILESVMKDVISGFHLDGLDRFLGFFIGLAEGLVIVCLVLFALYRQTFFDQQSITADSFFAKLLLPFIIGQSHELPKIIAFAGGKTSV